MDRGSKSNPDAGLPVAKKPRSSAADAAPGAGSDDGPAGSDDDRQAPPYEPRRVLGPGFRLLVLGDGDLSWSLATAQARESERVRSGGDGGGDTGQAPGPVHMVATTYDTAEELRARYSAERVDPIVAALAAVPGVEVRHGVDATRLARGDFFCGERPDRIVFNFPHWGGQGHIERNRKLLATFFQAAAQMLRPQDGGGDGGGSSKAPNGDGSGSVHGGPGEVVVALVAGQGGTPGDKDLGAAQNSWRAVELAHAAGLVLTCLRPFEPPGSGLYRCSGRRGRVAGFWLGGALEHVFCVAGDASLPSLHAPSFTLDVSFWVLDEAALGDGAGLAACFASADADGCLVSFRPAPSGALRTVRWDLPAPRATGATATVEAPGTAEVSGVGGGGGGGGGGVVATLPPQPAGAEMLSVVWRAVYRAPAPLALGKQAALDLHEACKARLTEGYAHVVSVRGQKARPATVR